MYEFYSVHEKVGVWIKAVPRPAGQIRRLNRALERPTRIRVIVIAFFLSSHSLSFLLVPSNWQYELCACF